MSIVQYDGNRLIPAPLVNISRSYNKTGDGQIIGSVYSLILQGEVIAFKGSPKSGGTFHTGAGYPDDESIADNARLKAIMSKQDALRGLFDKDNEGKLLWFQALDSSVPMSGYPRINTINFPPGQWFNRAPYTIELELDQLGPEKEDSFDEYILSGSENWEMATDEATLEAIGKPRTYRLTHTVNAQGKRTYVDGSLEKPAWWQARDWVQAKLGFDSDIALSSGVINLPSYYSGYNHVRNENVGEYDGTYGVTEMWVLASGTALEDFTVSTTHDLSDGLVNVALQGNITGMEQRDSDLNLTTSKYDNAATKFVVASGLAFSRAQTYSGITLNYIPKSWSVGKNPVAGTIQYNYAFDNRASNLISGALQEVISVADTAPGGRQYAEIFILERTAGPIMQDLATRPSFKRTLNIELTVPPPTVLRSVDSIKTAFYEKNPRMDTATSGDINNIITAIDPSQIGINASHSDPPTESWDFKTGRYSYTRSWSYVPSG